MHILLRTLSLISISIFCSGTLHAETTVIENIEAYEINPRSLEQLVPSLNNASPVRENNKVFHAHTKTHVSWRFWWDSQPHRCKITKTSTTVTINYDLPKLESGCCSASIMDVWNQYYPALLKHEQGHGQIAIDAAEEIERVLLGMPAFEQCKNLEQEANKRAEAVLERFRPEHQTYDGKTGHGRTEGAYIQLYLDQTGSKPEMMGH